MYLLAVAVREGVGHLVDVLGRDALLESPLGLLLQVLVKLALRRELEDEVDSALVVEISEETENVRVPEMGLDLYFSPEHNIYIIEFFPGKYLVYLN